MTENNVKRSLDEAAAQAKRALDLLRDEIANARQEVYRLEGNGELTPVQCLEQMRAYALAALDRGDDFEMYDAESGHITVTTRHAERGKRRVYIHGNSVWERDEPDSYVRERIANACMFAVPKERT